MGTVQSADFDPQDTTRIIVRLKVLFDRFLSNVDDLLAETRPPLRKTLANLDVASAKVSSAIDKADVTLDNATALTKSLNQVVLENRAEIHAALLNLRAALVDAQRLIVNADSGVPASAAKLDLDELSSVCRSVPHGIWFFPGAHSSVFPFSEPLSIRA